MSKLALLGGPPVRTRPFPDYVTIGEEEKRAVMEVLNSTVLSRFLGTWSPDFYGGPRIQALERAWEAYFGVKHAISVNSATSGLYAAVGAAGIEPGDEVIVSPYTMTASATAALVYGGIPVFADIDPETFCITPETIRRCLTSRTKAIIVVDIFGHPADMNGIMALAEERGLVVIEDAAQAPGATLNGRPAGTLGHMGVFSLNYHKTIHCGEGGVVVTNDSRFAERIQLIRNHGEVVVKHRGLDDIVNLVGFNYRMTEIEAAIATEQLKKLARLTAARQHAAAYLNQRLDSLTGLTLPHIAPNATHGYYLYAIKYNHSITGVSREKFVAALKAEGIPFATGYVEPIYLEPMYQRKIAFGSKGYPFSLCQTESINYQRGLCPVTERMHFEELIYTPLVHAGLSEQDLCDIADGIEKVASCLAQLS